MPPAIAGEIMKVLIKKFFEKGMVIGVLAIVLAIIVAFIFYNIIYPEDKYFENFTPEQVENIVVYPWFVSSQITEAVISESDKARMIELLERVRLVGKSTPDGFRLQGGRWVMFRIELTTGEKFDFAVNAPYYIIDRQRGYKTKDKENCHAIYDLYYELVEKYCGMYYKK